MLQLTRSAGTVERSPLVRAGEPTRRARSSSRLEKPHSLSNQPRTLTPPSAVVCVPDGSNRQDAGLFLTSIETVGSGSYASTPRNGPAAASAIARLTSSTLTLRSVCPDSSASEPIGVGTQ